MILFNFRHHNVYRHVYRGSRSKLVEAMSDVVDAVLIYTCIFVCTILYICCTTKHISSVGVSEQMCV